MAGCNIYKHPAIYSFMRDYLILLVLLSLVSVGFAVDISSCSNISFPGEYTLTQNISGVYGSYGCIEIGSPNVVFDCNNHNLSGADSFFTGIYTDQPNVSVINCNIFDYYTGIYYYHSDDSSVTNTNVSSCSDAFVAYELDNITITANNFSDNSNVGVYLGRVSNSDISDNTIGENQEFDLQLAVGDPVYCTNTLDDNTGSGGRDLVYVSNKDGETHDGGTVAEVIFCNVTHADITNLEISGSDSLNNNGMLLYLVNNSYFDNITSSDNYYGIYLEDGSNITITGSTANNNYNTGFYLYKTDSAFDCINNNLTGNTANGNNYSGFYIYGCGYNNLTGNTANGNNDTGFYIFDSAYNYLLENTAHLNDKTGFGIETYLGGKGYSSESTNNTLINNTATNNRDGFDLSSALNSTLIHNFAYSNNRTGLYIEVNEGGGLVGCNNTIRDSEFYNNSVGIFIQDDDHNSVYGSNVYNNSGGIVVSDANHTYLENVELYDNDFGDLFVVADSSLFQFDMVNVIFDSHLGDHIDYANVSISDLLNGSLEGEYVEIGGEYLYDGEGIIGPSFIDGYQISWSDQPAALPGAKTSFYNTHLNITDLGIQTSIDSLSFNWNSNRESNENNLQLWKYHGSEWTRLAGSLDTVSNKLTTSDVSSFSVFSLLLGQSDGDGDPDQDTLRISATSTCTDGVVANRIVVTDGSHPVSGVRLVYDGEIYYTNSNGEVLVNDCGKSVQLSASKSNYLPGEGAHTEISCEQCGVECTSNDDCSYNEYCSSGQCIPVDCLCGQLSDHQCSAYQCCADGDCGSSQICSGHVCIEKPECESNADCLDSEICENGSCKPLIACGIIQNHAIIQTYECGSEPNCPACSEGVCVDHSCFVGDVDCPTGRVGQNSTCSAKHGTEPCSNCDLQITDPAGNIYTGKTDENGGFNLPLTKEGNYKIALLKDGQLVKETTVISAPPEDVTPIKPIQTGFDWTILLWIPIVLLLLGAGLYYAFGRNSKKQK
ncbi:Periplasmic copper-binding protein (NosD) [Candidatus Bilamarchaeum dharawalense]|uniref:Periplasmic copper-binding protein (NosD) n=1 Tax=Candidatus Bilamarchaeum dharawalense TaxID=2885759 RepID=A0A5E4LMP5_9ARCH|nr:Periplasmic copper-binding protein (NosD) [Candidatus Bilamarchaeum dharawalense]